MYKYVLKLIKITKKKNSTRINDLREYENNLNFKEINFPVKVKDIQKFENQNPDLPGINVFSINENNKIYPLSHNEKDCQKTIDLFLFSKDEKQHYSLIKNFSRLTRSQITSDTTRKLHICKKCFTHFTKQDLFEKHLSYCNKNETVAVKMPTKNSILNFQNYFKTLPIPFAIYASSYNNTPSRTHFLYSRIQNPCHYLVILVPTFPVYFCHILSVIGHFCKMT